MAVSLSHDAVARAQRAADDILAAATDEEPRAFRLSLARIYRELLERGLRNSEIARRLEVSTHTAERHTERVLAKLGVHSRAAVGARLRDV